MYLADLERIIGAKSLLKLFIWTFYLDFGCSLLLWVL